jgi:hypothetical protein
MIVTELSPEEESRFSTLLDIYIDQSLTLFERFDKLDKYWGISPIIDDTVLKFQECLLEEMLRE